MEKKIIFILLGFALAACVCKNNTAVCPKMAYDTLYFSSAGSLKKYKKKFEIEGSAALNQGLIIPSQGQGVEVWIDSLFYFHGRNHTFISIASTSDYGTCLLYYNGDSLLIEKVAINTPSIEECKTNKHKIIEVSDSSYNSGYLIKSVLLYMVDEDGYLINKKSYFPQRKEPQAYDFVVTIRCMNDSIIIYKNNKEDLIWK